MDFHWTGFKLLEIHPFMDLRVQNIRFPVAEQAQCGRCDFK